MSFNSFYDLDNKRSLESIAETLILINKNLEKIANKPEQPYIVNIPNDKGAFYGPIQKELNLDTIICNKNKDGYVDKNIIL